MLWLLNLEDFLILIFFFITFMGDSGGLPILMDLEAGSPFGGGLNLFAGVEPDTFS